MSKRNISHNLVLLISAAIIIAAHVDLSLFYADFKVTLAVVIISAFIYHNDFLTMLKVMALSEIGILITKCTIYVLQGDTFTVAAGKIGPEMLYFLCFFLILSIYLKINKNKKIYDYIFASVICDYICNVLEIYIRIGLHSLTGSVRLGLITIALTRGAVLWLILTYVSQYSLMLLRKNNADRYERLMLMISKLKGEVIWMQKNAGMIEETMTKSYQMYQKIKDSGDRHLAEEALTIAKDIHEIKKEYLLIMRGLSHSVEEEIAKGGMHIDELLLLLDNSLSKEFPKRYMLSTSFEDKLYINDPYLFLTIFNNMMTNAIEAGISDTDNGNLTEINIREISFSDVIVIYFSNNGATIPNEYRSKIFTPGFSTKINYETGEIARGIGLCHVKDIIEEKYHGTIQLTDNQQFTEFKIVIPKGMLEERL